MAEKSKRKLITFGDKSRAELFIEKLTLALSIILLLISFIPQTELAENILRMISAVMAAYPVVEDMFEGISKKKISEPLFMIVAVFATWIVGEFTQAAVMVILYRVCRWLQKLSEVIASGSIRSMRTLTAESAHLVLESGGTESIDSKEIRKGMKLCILPHEIIPVDCVVSDGETTAGLQGDPYEDFERIIRPGDRLPAGAKNGSSRILAEAVEDASDSKIEKIISIVNSASEGKTSAEEKITVVSKYVSAAVAVAAVATGIIGTIVTGYSGTWIRNAVVILTASFASSVVALVPAPFIACLGRNAGKGTVLRNVGSIEKMSAADTVAFDNPGMFASGKLTYGEIFAETGYTEDDIISLALYYAEEADDDLLKEIFGSCSHKTKTDEKIICGDADVMKENGISVSSLPESSLYVSADGKAVGCIRLADKAGDGMKALTEHLKKLGKKTVLMSGKDGKVSDSFCSEAGIDECIPGNKNSALEKIMSGGHKVMYISDKPDYPANADIKAAAYELSAEMPDTADVIFTSEYADSAASALKQSRRAVNAVKINTGLLVLVKIAVIVLAFLSLAPAYISVLSETIAVVICIAVAVLPARDKLLKHTK